MNQTIAFLLLGTLPTWSLAADAPLAPTHKPSNRNAPSSVEPNVLARLLQQPPANGPATKIAVAWQKQAAADARQDRTTIAYDGKSPNKLVCDTTLRELADGSWALFMLAGDDFEPSPGNFIGLTRSRDQGRTWSPLQPVDIGMPREGKTSGQGPTELMVRGDRNTLFFSTHSQTWGRDWKSWMMRSDDLCRTWSKPEPVPGRLADFTFIRNHIVTRDGRIIIPFQHYLGPGPDAPPPAAEGKPWHKALRHYVSNPRNGGTHQQRRRQDLERARRYPPHRRRSLSRLGGEQYRRAG